MRKEIETWFEQAENDYESAKILFEHKKLSSAVFFCHQACEKVLKYLIMLKTKEQIIISHSLIYLGKEAGVPTDILNKLKRLNPHYTLSRYPGAEGDLPEEIYTEADIKDYLKTTKELLEWIRKQKKQ